MKSSKLLLFALFIIPAITFGQDVVSCGQTMTVSTVGLSNTTTTYTHNSNRDFVGPNNFIEIENLANECNICVALSNGVNGVGAFIMTDPTDFTTSRNFFFSSGNFCFTPAPGQSYYIMIDGLDPAGGQIDVSISCDNSNCPCISNGTESLEDGLVSYWNFDGDLTDQIGVNNGTAVGPELNYIPGVNGQAIDLNSIGVTPTYVNLGNDPSLNFSGSSLTISVWVRIDGLPFANWPAIISKGESCNYRIAAWRDQNFVHWNGSNPDVLGLSAINDGQFHHIVGITENNSYKAIYVDGILEGANSIGTAICDGGVDLLLGSNPAIPARVWNGAIDEVKIWNRALCQNEVQQLFIGPSPIPTLSEWGLIILILVMLCMGVAAIKSRKIQAKFN